MTSEALVNWLACGQRGISSDAIVQHLTGIQAARWAGSHPHDPSDLGRCRLLLEQVPELAPRIGETAVVSPAWRVLVEHWDDLCSLMDEEAPQWRDQRGNAPRTYSRMRELLATVGAW